jgi:leucyl/phenylalanyl-tRNA--protein transferase
MSGIPALEVGVRHERRPQALPACRYRFPDPATVSGDLVAVGGDFEPATIVEAYRRGIFPWPHEQEELLWFSPHPRAVLPLDGLHVSRRLARTIRQGRFRLTLNEAFADVLQGCAERPEGTWITPRYRRGYLALHDLGWAHSVEAWAPDGALAGGVYGVSVGGLFGAESMFHRVTDASKVALAALVQHAARKGVCVLDIQVLTPHTARLGAIEIPPEEYLRRVKAATRQDVAFGTR